jgi:ribosomal protein S18 acetylase RimI-like enzyme
MSLFTIERLSPDHDRAAFNSGLESVDRYLRETARGHLQKSVSITRVMTPQGSVAPKPIAAYFTLSSCPVEAAGWPGAAKGLPRQPLTAIVLGRLGVDKGWQGQGLGEKLIGVARHFALQSIEASGGVGLVVDAANEALIAFYKKFGFRQVEPGGLRLFLPTASLRS